LVGRLVGRSVGWSVGWLVGRLIVRSVGWLVSWLVRWIRFPLSCFVLKILSSQVLCLIVCKCYACFFCRTCWASQKSRRWSWVKSLKGRVALPWASPWFCCCYGCTCTCICTCVVVELTSNIQNWFTLW
jgi:hypothetical protein